MIRLYPYIVTICFCQFVTSSLVDAQESVDELKARVAELERENQRLRNLLATGTYTQRVQGGVETRARTPDGRNVTLVVAPRGWGGSQAQDVAAVCVSTAEIVFKAIAPPPGREPKILVVPDAQGPMVLSARGPRGEYVVLLNTRDRLWAQLAYQFSHELGHVVCGDLSLKMPQHWFEEAFCESMSLWTLSEMGTSWKTNAPYPNWSSYAPNLKNYIENVKVRVSEPSSIPDWYRQNRKLLDSQAYDRDKNLVVARRIASFADADPEFYRSFLFMRRKTESQVNSMEWLFADWIENCPPDLRNHPRNLAKLLGITPSK